MLVIFIELSGHHQNLQIFISTSPVAFDLNGSEQNPLRVQ